MKLRDFIAKVDEVQQTLKEHRLSYGIKDVCRMAASQEAPRFYIDELTALRKYSLYKKGKCIVHSNEKRKMYAEIFSRYERALNTIISSGQKFSKPTIMREILSQTAPSFYYEDGFQWWHYYHAMDKFRKKQI